MGKDPNAHCADPFLAAGRRNHWPEPLAGTIGLPRRFFPVMEDGMTKEKDDAKHHLVREPVGLDKTSTDDGADPTEEKAIELPVEEGDFNSQPG